MYRAVDQHSQVIDVYVSKRRNLAAATRFFETLLAGRERPPEITTDLAAPLLRVVDELLPDALHDTTHCANNRIECDPGRLKARLRPWRGLRTDRTATVVTGGHAFIQDLRRGHYELGVAARRGDLIRDLMGAESDPRTLTWFDTKQRGSNWHSTLVRRANAGVGIGERRVAAGAPVMITSQVLYQLS